MPRLDHTALERASLRLGKAVLDPAQWPELMAEICSGVGARGALLLQTDVRLNTLAVPVTESIKETAEVYFRCGWYLHDSRARGIPLLMQGVPVYADCDIFTPELRRKDPFYNEFAVRGGLDWFAAVGFWSGSALWAMSIQRNAQQGPFEKHETRHLAKLSQKLTEVATLSKAVGRAVLTGSTNALNAVRHPAVALDHFGQVLEANTSMQAMLDEHIRIGNRRLVLSDPEARAALERLTDRMARLDGAVLAIEPIVVRRQGHAPVVLRALPVPPAAQNPFLGARAILTFDVIGPRPRPDTALLAKLFGLTPAEARFAAGLAGGARLESIAGELTITRETARNRLKTVFAKTGTHRQAELVALLARL